MRNPPWHPGMGFSAPSGRLRLRKETLFFVGFFAKPQAAEDCGRLVRSYRVDSSVPPSGRIRGVTVPLTIPAANALLLVGGVLLGIGWRGRRVDDHPLCRRCGFDLTGLPGGSNCPECGADVAAPKAVRVGHRRRRTALILLGLAVMLVPLVGGGVALRGVDPTPYKPAWWLMREADSKTAATAATASAALDELGRRQAAGKLSASAVDALVGRALAVQADSAAPWDGRWGGFVEAARAAGTLTDARWGQYARQAFEFELIVRPRVLRGDPLPITFSIKPPRLGPAGQFKAVYQWKSITLGTARLGPAAVEASEPSALQARSWMWGNLSGNTVVKGTITAELPPGPTAVAATIAYTIRDWDGNWDMDAPQPPLVLASGEVSADGITTVLRRDAPDLAPAMRAAVSVTLRRTPASNGKPARLFYNVVVRKPPAGLMHEVDVRVNGKEVRLVKALNVKAGFGAMNAAGSVKGPDPAGVATADVILRPNLEAVRRDLDGTRPWGGEIVLKDVPILPAAE